MREYVSKCLVLYLDAEISYYLLSINSCNAQILCLRQCISNKYMIKYFIIIMVKCTYTTVNVYVLAAYVAAFIICFYPIIFCSFISQTLIQAHNLC